MNMNEFTDFAFYWSEISPTPRRNILNDRVSQVYSQMCLHYDLELDHRRLERNVRNTKPGIYIIEFSYCSEPEHARIHDILLNDEILNILVRDSIPVVIWLPEEKDEYPIEYDNIMHKVFNVLTEHRVKVYLVGGNTWRKFSPNLDDALSGRFYFPIFDFNFYRGAKLENFDYPPPNYNLVTKPFICLNNVAREGKVYILAMMKDAKLFKNNNVSLIHSVKSNRIDNEIKRIVEQGNISAEDKVYRLGVVDKFIDTHISYTDDLPPEPLYLDRTRDGFDSWEYLSKANNYIGGLRKFYTESAFALVNETHTIPEGEICITEKIYYPMAYGKPFMVNAPQHYLKQLKLQGFQTFPEIFDESYDDIPCAMERMDFIVNELKRLNEMPIAELVKKIKSVNHKLKYNQSLLQNRAIYQHRLLLLMHTITPITERDTKWGS